MKNYRFSVMPVLVVICLLALINPIVEACTRVVYLGLNETVLTARSMDWKEDMKTNLWIFPRGMQRNGAVGAKSLKWK